MRLIHRHSANLNGRDFVVGDLHGCLFHLERLLENARFDPAIDRVFSVGDLADRGPDSPGCLLLLNEPWFYPVLGNHDLCLLQFLRGLEAGKKSSEAEEALDILLYNGGDWILDEIKPLLLKMPELASTLESVPLIRTIGSPEDPSRFHVLHGDLYLATTVLTDIELDRIATDLPEEDLVLEGSEITARDFTQHLTWSRRLFKNPGHYGNFSTLPGLSPTYVGHSIVTSLRQVASHIYIDGGVFLPPDDEKCHGLHLIDHLNQLHYWTNGCDVRINSLDLPHLALDHHTLTNA
jgi:serine/threonine protein phosphatase 1